MSVRSYMDAAEQVVAIAEGVRGVRLGECKPFIVQILRDAGESGSPLVSMQRMQSLYKVVGAKCKLPLDTMRARLQVACVLNVLEGRIMLSNKAFELAQHVKQGRESGKWRRPSSGERTVLQSLPARA